MKSGAPPLLPLLRSRLQAELLTLVLLSPGREWSLTELAQRVGASVATAQREVAPGRADRSAVLTPAGQPAPGHRRAVPVDAAVDRVAVAVLRAGSGGSPKSSLAGPRISHNQQSIPGCQFAGSNGGAAAPSSNWLMPVCAWVSLARSTAPTTSRPRATGGCGGRSTPGTSCRPVSTPNGLDRRARQLGHLGSVESRLRNGR
jgi:hypothetical protein